LSRAISIVPIAEPRSNESASSSIPHPFPTSQTGPYVGCKTLGSLRLIVAAAVGVYVYQERPWDEERHEITGSVTLYDEDLLLYEAQTGSGCTGSGGFSNIAWQATVTVYDGSGNVVGSSRLDFGDAIDRTTCRFPFTVLDVRDADFYEVRVAGRNGPTYSRQDLELPGWSVHLSIGDQS
jgi:hypothetical protein